MCPPAQPPPCEISLYWSDEQIISLLADYYPGSCLPINVIDDSNPFLYPPSSLPEGMVWYLVNSNEKKESVHGFWKAKGEACKVYSNPVINGWRTTLEYFEGLAPDGKVTDWIMQEYMITPKEFSDTFKQKDSRTLCSVFECKGKSSSSEMNPQKCNTIIESKNINPAKIVNPDTKIASDQDAGNESQANGESEVEASPVVDDKPNSPSEYFSETECFSRGDFLELNDLLDPESHSSSSQNSSCPSKLSEESFGSSTFLRDIEEAVANSYKEEQLSSSRYQFSTSIVDNDVILQPPQSGTSVWCDPDVRANVTETSRTRSDTDNSLADKKVQGNSTKRHSPDSKTEGTSNPQSPGAPSASRDNAAAPSEERKSGGSGKMKKFRTYFCFATF